MNEIPFLKKKKTNAKGGVAAWPDVQKSGATLGNLTPADRHGSVQVCPFCGPRLIFLFLFAPSSLSHKHTYSLIHPQIHTNSHKPICIVYCANRNDSIVSSVLSFDNILTIAVWLFYLVMVLNFYFVLQLS